MASFQAIRDTLEQVDIRSRRFFITNTGLMGLGPPQTRVDDQVFLLDGGSCPFLLRPTGRASLQAPNGTEEIRYKLVGDCYIQGLMYGEGLTDCPKGWRNVYLR